MIDYIIMWETVKSANKSYAAELGLQAFEPRRKADESEEQQHLERRRNTESIIEAFKNYYWKGGRAVEEVF